MTIRSRFRMIHVAAMACITAPLSACTVGPQLSQTPAAMNAINDVKNLATMPQRDDPWQVAGAGNVAQVKLDNEGAWAQTTGSGDRTFWVSIPRFDDQGNVLPAFVVAARAGDNVTGKGIKLYAPPSPGAISLDSRLIADVAEIGADVSDPTRALADLQERLQSSIQRIAAEQRISYADAYAAVVKSIESLPAGIAAVLKQALPVAP